MNKIILIFVLFSSLVNAQFKTKPIEYAIDFLIRNKETKDYSYNLQLMTHWLNNQYTFKPSLKQIPLGNKKLNPDEQIPYSFFNSIIEKKNIKPIDSLIYNYNKTLGIEHLLLWASNSNSIRFDSECKKTILEKTPENLNIRQISHIALAYRWSKYNQTREENLLFKNYITFITPILLEKIKKEDSINDNWLEGIIGLICFEKPNLVKKRWLKKLLQKQNKDGGWSWDPDEDKSSNIHTTLLALWIIKEFE